MPLIPLLITSLFSALATVLPALVARVVTSAGFGLVTYQLGSYGIDIIFNKLKTQVASIPPEAIVLMDLARIDDGIGIVLGGVVASMALRQTASGSITKMVVKGDG